MFLGFPNGQKLFCFIFGKRFFAIELIADPAMTTLKNPKIFANSLVVASSYFQSLSQN